MGPHDLIETQLPSNLSLPNTKRWWIRALTEEFAGVWRHASTQLTKDAGACKAVGLLRASQLTPFWRLLLGSSDPAPQEDPQ